MKALLASLAVVGLAAPSVFGAKPVEYVRDIKPLLAQQCYSCHGPAKQRGGLRLDSVALAIQGGKHGPAIVPGKSAASTLFQSVAHTGKIRRMPPRGPGFTQAQLLALKSWIDGGARAPVNENAANAAAAAQKKPAGNGERGPRRFGRRGRGFRKEFERRKREYERRREDEKREGERRREGEKRRERDDDD